MTLKMYEKVFRKVECNKEVKPQVTSAFIPMGYETPCTTIKQTSTALDSIQFGANNTLANRNVFDEAKPIDETVNSHQFPTRLNYANRIQEVHKVKK